MKATAKTTGFWSRFRPGKRIPTISGSPIRSGNSQWCTSPRRFSHYSNRKDALFAYYRAERGWVDVFVDGIMIGILMLAIAYNIFLFVSIRDRTYLYFGIALFFFTLDRNTFRIQALLFEEYPYAFRLAANFFFIAFFLFFLQSLRRFTGSLLNRTRNNRFITYLLAFTAFINLIFFFSFSIPGAPADEILLLEEIMVRVVLLLWGPDRLETADRRFGKRTAGPDCDHPAPAVLGIYPYFPDSGAVFWRCLFTDRQTDK